MKIDDFVSRARLPVLDLIGQQKPWEVVTKLDDLIRALSAVINTDEYHVKGEQWVHKSAVIEPNAQLKGPMIIGPECFVANGALLRGNVILDAHCIVGHCGELKTSLMFTGSKIAHLNFVGDSILGAGANVEGGAIIANYRNELEDKEIIIAFQGETYRTGVEKFGALLGDDCRVGANAVIAPGAIFEKSTVITRGAVIDQRE